jgi:DNA-binding CsgD family transcriptional regulator
VAHLFDRATVYGWLMILAALEPAARDGEEDPVVLVKRCPLPVFLADLAARRVLAMSASFAELMRVVDETADPVGFTNDPTLFPSLCDLLQGGAVDGYEARRVLRRGDGSPLEVDVWATVTLDMRRLHGLWLIAPVGADLVKTDGDAVHPLDVSQRDTTGVTVGVFGSSWQIEQISDNARQLFGRSPSELIGTSMLDHLHPDGAAGFLAAVGQSLATRGAVAVDVPILQLPDPPRETSIMITPLAGTALAGSALQFGFVAAPAPPAHVNPVDLHQRVALLERRFRRIAQEVEAAGFLEGAKPSPEVGDQPGLSDLSARQWEILARLVRGERVPGIAEAMFVNQSTVRSHLSAIYRRLGVHSQAELLARLRSDPTQP